MSLSVMRPVSRAAALWAAEGYKRKLHQQHMNTIQSLDHSTGMSRSCSLSRMPAARCVHSLACLYLNPAAKEGTMQWMNLICTSLAVLMPFAGHCSNTRSRTNTIRL